MRGVLPSDLIWHHLPFLTTLREGITAASLGLSASGGFQSELPLIAGESLPPGGSEPSGPEAAEGIPLEIGAPDGNTTLSIAELEKRAIRIALQKTDGNRTQAAAKLGISIRTLRNKLHEYREAGDELECVNE